MPDSFPPGPTGRGWLGSLPRMRRDPLGLLTDAVRDHGEIVHLRLATRHVVLVASPEHVRRVLQENARNYSKQTPGFRSLRTFLADGLLTNEGDAWLRQRRIVQPAFHRTRTARFAETMTTAAQAVADRWDRDPAPAVDLTAEMMRLTLRIVGETLLGTDVTHEADRVGQALTVALRSANRSITRIVPMPDWWPTRSNFRLRRSLAALDAVVYEMIRTRRRRGEDTGDLLSMLMGARDEDTGELMSDRQLRDEVMTIFLAGHETTAIALGWTWFLLSKYPAVRRRLQGELNEVLGGRPPAIEDLPRLRYTEQVVKESIRLFPPAWIISRRAIGADDLGGVPIPAGTLVFTSPYVTHRLARVWANPEGFDPERFGPERSGVPLPFAYFPFGGGPRQCIGNAFALMEMVLVIATIAQRYRLDLVAGQAPGLAPGITLRPSAPIQVTRHRVTDRDDIAMTCAGDRALPADR